MWSAAASRHYCCCLLLATLTNTGTHQESMCNRYKCDYILQVKQRMRNREQYQDFLKCLSLFSEDIISKQELINLMMDSLSRHPDLQVCWPTSTHALCRTSCRMMC